MKTTEVVSFARAIIGSQELTEQQKDVNLIGLASQAKFGATAEALQQIDETWSEAELM